MRAITCSCCALFAHGASCLICFSHAKAVSLGFLGTLGTHATLGTILTNFGQTFWGSLGTPHWDTGATWYASEMLLDDLRTFGPSITWVTLHTLANFFAKFGNLGVICASGSPGASFNICEGTSRQSSASSSDPKP